jgi:transcription antitermination factor NusG
VGVWVALVLREIGIQNHNFLKVEFGEELCDNRFGFVRAVCGGGAVQRGNLRMVSQGPFLFGFFQAAFPPMASWAVVVSSSMRERMAREELLANYAMRGLRVLLFRYKDAMSRTKVREGLLFPRYLFVDGIVDSDLSQWRDAGGIGCYEVRKTRGVQDIIMMNGRPARVSDEEVQALQAREDREGFIWLRKPDTAMKKFHSGQRVRVAAGPFSGLVGVVKGGMNATERCAVLLNMLGRKVPIRNMLASDLEAA